MRKWERVSAILHKLQPDRPPVSFWYHFGPGKEYGEAAVAAHIEHFERYNLDFLKVMNDNNYPRDKGRVLEGVKDVAALPSYQGTEEPFMRQLHLLGRLREELGRGVWMTTTVFSPWSVLRKLAAPDSEIHGPPSLQSADPRDVKLSELIAADRQAVADALLRIGDTLARFAQLCLEAGANGIFLSVRDDWVDTPENGPGTYDEIVRPADMLICDAVSAGKFNMLHICGRPLDFKAFAAYPAVQVINWADRYAGPPIAEVAPWAEPAICAGVDNLRTLTEKTPADCAGEVRDALEQAGNRPILIAPGCTYDPLRVPEENLKAMVAAVQEARY